MNDYGVERIACSDDVSYHCKQCGNCCRRVEASIMMDSMDIFRIAKHLQQKGAIEEISQVIADYTEAHVLSDNGFIVLMLKTAPGSDACIFLHENRCLIQNAKPRVCRLYPFSVGPGEHGQEYSYWLCHDRHDKQHYYGPRITTHDWLSQNFDEEDRAYLKAEYQASRKLDFLLGCIGERSKKTDAMFLFYRYFIYDLDESFLPQYYRYTEELVNALTKLSDASITEENCYE